METIKLLLLCEMFSAVIASPTFLPAWQAIKIENPQKEKGLLAL